MKNSEMKTIIRHIDRLTRNLNVKGRRRDASRFNSEPDKDLAITMSALRHQCDSMSQLLSGYDKMFSKSGSLQKEINNENFELAQKYFESFERELNEAKKINARIRNLIKIAIKAQRS